MAAGDLTEKIQVQNYFLKVRNGLEKTELNQKVCLHMERDIYIHIL